MMHGDTMKPMMHKHTPPPPPPPAKDGMKQMPTTYTSPSGIMKHYSPQQQRMMRRRMDMKMNPEMMKMHEMMRQGMMSQEMMMKHDKMTKGKGCTSDCPMMQKNMMQHKGMMPMGKMHKGMMRDKNAMAQKCTMCSRIRTSALTPSLKNKLLNTLQANAAENKPYYDKLYELKKQHRAMKMSASQYKNPAKRSQLMGERAKVLKALKGNLARQQREIKNSYKVDVGMQELMMHDLHQMQVMQPMPMQDDVYMMDVRRSPMLYDEMIMLNHGLMMDRRNPLEKGYRDPQKMNPQYNQEYLRRAPMREGYSGQTYK